MLDGVWPAKVLFQWFLKVYYSLQTNDCPEETFQCSSVKQQNIESWQCKAPVTVSQHQWCVYSIVVLCSMVVLFRWCPTESGRHSQSFCRNTQIPQFHLWKVCTYSNWMTAHFVIVFLHSVHLQQELNCKQHKQVTL